jgi:hypothetical protein
LKIDIFWDVVPSGLVYIPIFEEERAASIFKGTPLYA